MLFDSDIVLLGQKSRSITEAVLCEDTAEVQLE